MATIGMKMLHQSAQDICELFAIGSTYPGSPTSRLIITYRACYRGMEKCYSRDDFWKWIELAAVCDSALVECGIMANDPMPAAGEAGEADVSPEGK